MSLHSDWLHVAWFPLQLEGMTAELVGQRLRRWVHVAFWEGWDLPPGAAPFGDTGCLRVEGISVAAHSSELGAPF